MKPCLTLLLFCLYALVGQAQTKPANDDALIFDQSYTKLENRWVVLPKADTAKTYQFGYIYIDSKAGFTYALRGKFSVAGNGTYKGDTSMFADHQVIARIPYNWQKVAPLPSNKIKELRMPEHPVWVKNYYRYTDTVSHNYRWGWIYNDVGEPAMAISYLEPAYRMSNKADSITFELGFSYNAVNDFKKAIEILEPATQLSPNYFLYYKELGYAYFHLAMNQKAIATYERGLAQFPDEKTESRWELAYNLAHTYNKIGNAEKYKEWMLKAKEYLPENSEYNKIMREAGY